MLRCSAGEARSTVALSVKLSCPFSRASISLGFFESLTILSASLMFWGKPRPMALLPNKSSRFLELSLKLASLTNGLAAQMSRGGRASRLLCAEALCKLRALRCL